jgi:predicted ribosomally synthesized peptide with SipW-like signal peptide
MICETLQGRTWGLDPEKLLSRSCVCSNNGCAFLRHPHPLQVNSVGFYQLSKICITPAVLVFDATLTDKYPTRKEVGAVCVLCIGVTLATLTDKSVTTNMLGLAVALAAICFTAVYQVLPSPISIALAASVIHGDHFSIADSQG